MMLPKNWSLVSLGEIAASGRGTFSNGPFGSDLVKADLTDGGTPIIYIRDIRDGYYDRVSASCVTEKKAEQLSACWVKPGDVLITKVGDPPGTAAVYPEDQPLGIVTQDVIRLRLNSEVADSRYVRNWLNSPLGKHAVKSITVETTRARFPLGDFKNLKIPLPPIAEQRRIAAILDRADAVRRKRQEAIALTEELLRLAFLEMFGDLFAFTSNYGDSHPKAWIKCQLGDQLTLQRGFDIMQKQCLEGDHPVISSGGISAYHSEYKAIGPGVLLGRKGSVGRVHYVQENYWPHDTTLWVKDFKGNHPTFIYYFFKLFPISNFEESTANPTLNRNRLHPVEVFWPTYDYQTRFASVFESINKCRRFNESAISESDNLFNSLLQRAFRGEL